MDFNTPEVVRDPASFQRAAAKIGYTFNWFYADAEHIAYFNSGDNPVRANGVNHDFPVAAKFEWRGWNPDTWQARFTGFDAHPQAVDQPYLVNWNNKQAKAYRSSDDNAYSSTYRSVLLEDRVKQGIAGDKKMTLPQLIDAMEVAGTGDLRAWVDLPLALKVIGNPSDPALRDAVDEAARVAPRRRPAPRPRPRRRLRALGGDPDHGRVVAALGRGAVQAGARPEGVRHADQDGRDRQPAEGSGEHHGSSYQGSFYGYVSKDLRTVLGPEACAASTRARTAARSSAAAPRCGARWRPR